MNKHITQLPPRKLKTKDRKKPKKCTVCLRIDEHERTERKAIKPVDDWRRHVIVVVLHSEPESSLLHLIEPTVL